MHQSSLDLCELFVSKHLSKDKKTRIADVGSCDINGSYRNLFSADAWEYVGFDVLPGKNVDVAVGDPWCVPVEHHKSFDVVISGQTLEHTRKPWRWIQDVASLAKPGGIIWIAAPNTFHYHEYPIDCWRIWPDGMRAIFDEAGLAEIECYKVGIDTVGIARAPERAASKPERSMER